MKHLLDTGNGADMHFLVGGGDEKEATEQVKPVEVPDVEAEAFKTMLAFIYADDLSGLNGDNAMTLLYAVFGGNFIHSYSIEVAQRGTAQAAVSALGEKMKKIIREKKQKAMRNHTMVRK
uniref:BTB domain-containing protein n=1 Tax=Globodera pallida TaxID=36090 RepID=A0A183CKD4_GLOPA